MFPGSESQKVHLPVPLLLPAIPVPTPTLLGGLLRYPGGGGRDLPGHKLLAVLLQALGSSAESAPCPAQVLSSRSAFGALGHRQY